MRVNKSLQPKSAAGSTRFEVEGEIFVCVYILIIEYFLSKDGMILF